MRKNLLTLSFALSFVLIAASAALADLSTIYNSSFGSPVNVDNSKSVSTNTIWNLDISKDFSTVTSIAMTGSLYFTISDSYKREDTAHLMLYNFSSNTWSSEASSNKFRDLGAGSYMISFNLKDQSLAPFISPTGTIRFGAENEKNPGAFSLIRYEATVSRTPNTSSVPVPGAIWLLGSGIAGMLGLRRKFSA